ncbi:MAG: dihydropteroate synthase [Muribaculaceae bacterium]|nr:dihydropteroate synthase [Muribaculaceae bacterium]
MPFSLNLRGRLVEFDRPQVMGIINVTPDSFYSKSRLPQKDALSQRLKLMLSQGVDMIDVGAYSTRPGASDVSVDEELGRLAPALEVIRDIAPDVIVSVDTFRAEVAREAVQKFKVDIVNDISGGQLDDNMFETVAELRVPYVLTHSRLAMDQVDYVDVTADVITELSEKVAKLSLLGVSDVIIDPGFGFSKTLEQNYDLLLNLHALNCFNKPILVGVSRKSIITRVLDIEPENALNGTTVINTISLLAGASILRVHDVLEAVQAVKLVRCYNKK